MYNEQLESLIDAALADGELTEKEKQILFKKAQSMGIDLDEFEMVLDARLYKLHNEQKAQAIPTSAPKSDKFGDIKKCPSCGAMVESFSTTCPDCGYAFRNIEANSSIKKLFEMLNEVENNSRKDPKTLLGGVANFSGDVFSKMISGGTKDQRKRKAIIQNFPIPTTKEDILEFLSLAAPLAKKPGIFSQDEDAKQMYPIWKNKCEQIIMKARFSMKDDKVTLAEIMEYAKKLKIKL